MSSSSSSSKTPMSGDRSDGMGASAAPTTEILFTPYSSTQKALVAAPLDNFEAAKGHVSGQPGAYIERTEITRQIVWRDNQQSSTL